VGKRIGRKRQRPKTNVSRECCGERGLLVGPNRRGGGEVMLTLAPPPWCEAVAGSCNALYDKKTSGNVRGGGKGVALFWTQANRTDKKGRAGPARLGIGSDRANQFEERAAWLQEPGLSTGEDEGVICTKRSQKNRRYKKGGKGVTSDC